MDELIARLEAAAEGSQELDIEIGRLVGTLVGRQQTKDGPISEWTHWRYTTSLDAALTLIPEGWRAILYTENRCAELYDATLKRRAGIKSRADASTLPLALCIAALKARSHTPPQEK